MAHAQELAVAQEPQQAGVPSADGPVRSLWDPDRDEGESFVEGIFRTRLADVNQRLLEAQRQTAAAGPTTSLAAAVAWRSVPRLEEERERLEAQLAAYRRGRIE